MGLGIGIPSPGGGPPAWTPKSLGSTLKLWLRGDLGVTLNGSNVSAWADQSGNGNHVTQATGAKQPTFVASGINNKPTLTFDGGDVLDGSVALTGAANWSLFVVLNFTSTGSARQAVNIGNATTGYGASVDVNADFKRELLLNGVAAETDGVASATVNEAWLQTNSGTNGPQAFYLNGSPAPAFAGSGTTVAPAAEFHIGGRTNVPALPMLGKLAEVVVCDTPLGATDRAKLFAYSLARYGL